MHIGFRLLIKHEGKVQEGSVIKIYEEDLDIRLDSGEIVRRKFWEVRKPDEKKEETN
jgi:membrane protease subunit (stomatin/prohibitin family)